MELVSILIPAYNAEEWISEAIQSAIAQTWQRIEIILVDDGSTDRTLAVARQFEKDGIQVVTQENQGAAAARNKAFSLCDGDYIQWLDADDLLAPDKIANQMKVLNQNINRRTLLSAAWGRFTYSRHRAQIRPDALWCDLSPAEFLLRKLGQNLYMPNAAWLVSRELTEAAGPWDVNMFVDDDGEYFCRVLLASDGIRFVPDAKVYYRNSGPGSLSDIGKSDKKMDAQWRSMQLHMGYLRSLEESPRVDSACVTYLQNWLMYFYPNRLDLVKQAHNAAAAFGGTLTNPRFSWKYSWIKALFGWDLAKRAEKLLPGVRWSWQKFWDRVLLRFENRTSA
jgi:glycosyltransferase involved in cell wall biosynthesis